MLDAQLFPMTEGVKMKLRCRDVIGKTVVVDCLDDPWDEMVGTVIAIGKEGHKKEVIVQFNNPNEWSYFLAEELREID